MPKKIETETTVRLRGLVMAFNVSPKGHHEGVLVETKDGVVQINFAKHGGEELARSLKVGAKVDLHGELEADDGAHLVYRVVPASSETKGTITRLNYALHGEVNGYHLDDGTFLHVKPDGARSFKLRIGDAVVARGERRVGADAVVVEAHDVSKQR